MRKYLEDTVIAELTNVDNRRIVVLGVGVATFFFGFAAGAIANFYLLMVGSPLVLQFRSTLSYNSAIFGDGIILPIVNMIIMLFLLKHWKLMKKKILQLALFFGVCITAYFHVTQAVSGLVNWAMPTPWHWNLLGVWHAAYMLSVTSFLALFYLVLFRVMKKQKYIPKEAAIVTIGLVIFATLLRLDYITVDIRSLVPQL